MVNSHRPIDVGTHVFIIISRTDEVKEVVIAEQEWWHSANPDHPVYYDVVDLKGKPVYALCTGNWHFNEVYLTRSEAESHLEAMRRAR